VYVVVDGAESVTVTGRFRLSYDVVVVLPEPSA
jgi:hypothetical protein